MPHLDLGPHLNLGKYAAFIVPAYTITAVVLAAMVGASLAYSRRWRRKAEEFGRSGDE
jgi:heme exporter protein CcmD